MQTGLRHHRGFRDGGRARAGILVASLAALAVLLTACASLPDSSTPEAIGTIGQAPVESTAAPPQPGQEPDLLLRNFFEASTVPTNRHATARQYLTEDRARSWDDAASTVIVEKVDLLIDSRTEDTASYTVRATRVGQLASGSMYEPQEGAYEAKVRFEKVNGEWRIAEIPDGVMLDRPQFVKAYKNVALYFLDPTGNKVVPDLRWISAAPDQIAGQLVNLLVGGPKPALRGAVTNRLGAEVSLRSPLTKADGRSTSVGVGLGGVRADFQGISAGLSDQERKQLAAQVIWTLASAEVPGPYVLLADDKPLDEKYPQGWTTGDVAEFNPLSDPGADIGLHALRDGSLVAVEDNGVTPAPGYFGVARNLRSIGLSTDGNFIAAVVDSGRPAPEPPLNLIVGTYNDGSSPFAVDVGTTISRPSWAPDDGSAWAVIDESRVIRAVARTGEVSREEVDASAITALGKITELRLSRDGVRAALIVDGKVFIAVVVRQPDGAYVLTNPRQVALGLGEPDAISLDWASGSEVVVARSAADVPVIRVNTDGSRLDVLPIRNLSTPVTSVEASPTTEYVTDARAVFQLDNNDPPSDRYWREVPGLSGIRAIPVLPG
ncbi:MtrAB system accessory lipoprotein LpqB [Antrihabitans sp. YC2-6]|uniref:MtrAB system accessory lipoprotein LpqB n=1 Tax=Antrihabitans sp. YC2-6 TaxID=2799498 RepID=UPI0018F76335|nr:MtrAB system accessory lipoprotein LpqB [Antrihabitans sp. YC2-6]MBJ8347295.1 MtrAB system accessory protein LpqB [Antrihabitans sp. YC2-6]